METLPTPLARMSVIKKNIIGFSVVTVGIALTGVVTMGIQPMGWMRTTNVGRLPELAAVQAQLLPLDACEVEYGSRRGSGGRRWIGSQEYAYVTPCGTPSSYRISVRVPSERQVRDVAFDMRRSSVSAPWKILVDKDQTAFPALKQSLEQLAPFLLTQYPIERQKDADLKVRLARERQERKDAERALKEEAKNSYPE
ncbi:hypothetical protein MXAN_4383 [Myxococcus xanthus DK 1622]|uniref:Uncharacterized protein n=2 Tax=Myxococcaceae TaxID=31 RepID=Q1D467_MYXXD|nr:hypothetical protein [Myxococcus xanthus]ABF91566.1 hypothetical protein MXAN_4383 [Myxococcus xanthus DK 1622]QZZ52064.1 hypothetical protein MyxoNM_22910 [Myxococcus xanthus]UYI11800.1 hypothetical protein N3T43_22240 [Myxococcus xanthus]UYI19169.1 hypothetical protein N1129_22690 [Myxococcus xanthus]SDW80761.1 hypothetical protein SAMN05444383_103577 [Myxococcus xanthus]